MGVCWPDSASDAIRRRCRCGPVAWWPAGSVWPKPELVFRGPDHWCSHNPNEISALRPELVFRERPGKLVQRRGQPQRFWRGWGLRRALVDPPGDGVAWVPAAPTGLRLLPARGLAFRLPAGMLAASSRVRPEPPAANRTRSLPGLRHGDASWSPRVGTDGSAVQIRMPGSVLESTGGSILASAEAESAHFHVHPLSCRAPRCCCRSNAGTAGETCRKNLVRSDLLIWVKSS